MLVVEDEDAVRTLMRETLGRAGYRVIEAANGVEALEAATAHPARMDLLVTDLVMPGMSGLELADRLLSVRLGLRVLCISGYAEAALAGAGAPERAVPMLRKPFAMEALVRRVRETLDAPAPVSAGGRDRGNVRLGPARS